MIGGTSGCRTRDSCLLGIWTLSSDRSRGPGLGMGDTAGRTRRPMDARKRTRGNFGLGDIRLAFWRGMKMWATTLTARRNGDVDVQFATLTNERARQVVGRGVAAHRDKKGFCRGNAAKPSEA